MALMATFGKTGLVTPVASVVPSVLAKFSTVINPVIYMFFNNQVRADDYLFSFNESLYVPHQVIYFGLSVFDSVLQMLCCLYEVWRRPSFGSGRGASQPEDTDLWTLPVSQRLTTSDPRQLQKAEEPWSYSCCPLHPVNLWSCKSGSMQKEQINECVYITIKLHLENLKESCFNKAEFKKIDSVCFINSIQS